jgi:peptidoglycan/LPS O-acetylase OafA/YrhL
MVTRRQPLREASAPPPVVAPPPGNPRFPLLDGLRAIAALAVVALHATAYTNYFHGWEGAYVAQLAAGVTIFFLLSGFLLYRPFVRARFRGTNPIALRDFARRRLLRIVPAYWLALTALALWPGLPGSPLGSDWWRYFGFLQDFRAGTLFNGLGTAWSLGTEVSFYLLLPVYALVLARLTRGRSVRRVVVADLAVLTTLSMLSLGARLLLAGAYPNLGFTLLGTFDWFAVGMAVAVLSAAAEHTGATPWLMRVIWRWPSLCWFGAFLVLTTAAAYWKVTNRYDPYSGGPLHLIWAGMALFLLLPAAFPHGQRGLPRRVLSNPFVAWLGVISYGIYLWHLPLIPKVGGAISTVVGHPVKGAALTIVLAVCASACAVACAALSYYLVERPLLRFKNGFGRHRAARQTSLKGAPAVVETGA